MPFLFFSNEVKENDNVAAGRRDSAISITGLVMSCTTQKKRSGISTENISTFCYDYIVFFQINKVTLGILNKNWFINNWVRSLAEDDYGRV